MHPIGPVENGANEGTSEAHIARGGGAAIDIPAEYGAKVIAIHNAISTYSGWLGDAGIVVQYEFDTKDGHWLCRACHLMESDILVNYRIDKGDVIGLVGSTGDSTGPHLHFVMEFNGNRVYPENYL